MSNKNNEYLIYIHGISQDNNSDHIQTYNKLHDGISSVKNNFPNRSDWEEANRCYVEWGWNFDGQSSGDDTLSDHASHATLSDRLLADAQDKFAQRILPEIKKASDWTLNPSRLLLFTLRELMIKGFSDMFYYTSRDGKNSVRATVASQIIQSVNEPLEKDQPISLTFLGHSAGSVVAFDFLFYLFAPEEVLKKHEFIEPDFKNVDDSTIKDFKKLRKLAEAKKLRVRRLITFGSPISMLAFRSNAVLEILAQGNKLNPHHYGLNQNPEVFGNILSQPRWINFWDKDDVISWPVTALMQDSPLVEDIYSDAGDKVSKVHNQYWEDKKVHQQIAVHW